MLSTGFAAAGTCPAAQSELTNSAETLNRLASSMVRLTYPLVRSAPAFILE